MTHASMKYVMAGALLLLVLWAWLRAFAYFDPLSLCRIRIEVGLLDGNRPAIRRAIDVVRREDPVAYRTLCHFVDRITEERRCDAGDARVAPGDPALPRAHAAAGCYVRGSRILVLRRDDADEATTLRRRADALKQLAGFSAAFWTRRE
jgi:hypothetical protein